MELSGALFGRSWLGVFLRQALCCLARQQFRLNPAQCQLLTLNLRPACLVCAHIVCARIKGH
eukprot:3047318-Rhodomonas_salina.1